MDNMPDHKGPKVRQMPEAASAQILYLPPCAAESTKREAKLGHLLGRQKHRNAKFTKLKGNQRNLGGGRSPCKPVSTDRIPC